MIRRLRTEAEPFDFQGTYVQLTGAFCNPKPLQHPYPPILIGGRSAPVLRVAAEHADLWNIPRWRRHRRRHPPQRTAGPLLRQDRSRPRLGHRSIHLPVSYDQPGITRSAMSEAIDAGFRHIVLGLPAPYSANVAQWVAGELITASASPRPLR